jgi:hypothetical protein
VGGSLQLRQGGLQVLVEGQEQDNGNIKIGWGRDKAAGSHPGERVEHGHAHQVRDPGTKKARSKHSILCHESYNLNLVAKSAFDTWASVLPNMWSFVDGLFPLSVHPIGCILAVHQLWVYGSAEVVRARIMGWRQPSLRGAT